MTKETKLGLAVGGVFILLFAVILGHAQDQDKIQKQVASLDETADASLGLAEKTSSGRLPQLAGGSIPGPVASESQVVPSETKARSPQGNDPSFIPGHYVGVDGSAQSKSPLGQKQVIAPADDVVNALLRQSPPPSNPPHPSVTDAIIDHPSAPPGTGRAEGSDTPGGAGIPAGGPKAQSYVVGRNDTLTKIAQKFYGQPSKANIQKIVSANVKTMKDPNKLTVGQKLQIPVVAPESVSAQRTAGNLSSLPASKPERGSVSSIPENIPSAPRTQDAWTWYQTQPNDRYTTIARENLGDEKRWKEIYELNKTKFPNPDQIRSGVRIKLPAKSAAKNGG